MENEITKVVLLNLTGLELFFIATTLISLFINLYQLMVYKREKAAFQTPLTNSLIALFNDVKSKSTNVYAIQNLILHKLNPHKDISTIKWEYYQFCQTTIAHLIGFQESLVGVLATLNPKDKTGEQAFRAGDYGLTQEEKDFKKKFTERAHSKQFGEEQITKQQSEATENP